jgi:hypothetical protein
VWVGVLRVVLDVNPGLFPGVHVAPTDRRIVGHDGSLAERIR